jgi:hypothetical protein
MRKLEGRTLLHKKQKSILLPVVFTLTVFLCLLGSIAEAYDSETLTLPSTYLTTDKGVLATDYFPIPSESASRAAALKAGTAPLLAPLADTFKLHSNPGATKVIYLDFNGHDGMEPGADYYEPFNIEGSGTTFSNAELTVIQQAWQSASEDFLPFDVDVTTEDPGVEALRKTGGGDTHWGIRAVVSRSNWDYSWAYVGSFDWNTDYESQIYPGDNSWIWIADSISHEAGHALGLNHDGLLSVKGDDYYTGHGSGATYWTPIMGWTKMSEPYGVSQWDKGEYYDADNTEDDLHKITTQNGFGYRPDDHGSTPDAATAININNNNPEFVAEGIIERNTDIDYFTFTLSSTGDVQLIINPDNLAPNLDIIAKIHDANGEVLYTSNPLDALNAEFRVTLNAGDYYLSIDGTGFGSPPANGYSDYGSLGYYTIEAASGGGSDLPPSVDAGVSMITWSGEPVQLAPTVVNNSDPPTDLTYTWSADPADGVVFSDPDFQDPAVTITKAPGDALTVTLTLAVSDGVHPTPVTDTMTIDAYDDACKAAIGAGLAEDNPTDLDGNCITDLKDLAVMLTTWMTDTSLTEPVAK